MTTLRFDPAVLADVVAAVEQVHRATRHEPALGVNLVLAVVLTDAADNLLVTVADGHVRSVAADETAEPVAVDGLIEAPAGLSLAFVAGLLTPEAFFASGGTVKADVPALSGMAFAFGATVEALDEADRAELARCVQRLADTGTGPASQLADDDPGDCSVLPAREDPVCGAPGPTL